MINFSITIKAFKVTITPVNLLLKENIKKIACY